LTYFLYYVIINENKEEEEIKKLRPLKIKPAKLPFWKANCLRKKGFLGSLLSKKGKRPDAMAKDGRG